MRAREPVFDEAIEGGPLGLVAEFSMSHQEIATAVGLNRSSISNHLRLLELDDATKAALRGGALSFGHARALLSITNLDRRKTLAKNAIKSDWSVRELERRASQEPAGRPAAPSAPTGRPNTRDLERRLSDHLGTKVNIQLGRRKGTGRLIVDFYSLEQFEGLVERWGFDCGEE